MEAVTAKPGPTGSEPFAPKASSSEGNPNRLRRHYNLIAGIAVLLMGGCGWLLLTHVPAVPKFRQGPLVQLVDTDGFMLVWYTDIPATARLSIGNKKVNPNELNSLPDGRTEARFSGLAEDTLYPYEILDGNQVIFSGETSTSPAFESSFRILAFGDSGTGDSKQLKLASLMPEWEPDIILHTGDLINPDGETKDYPEKFYFPYRQLTSRIPFYTCIGNHDFRTDRGRPMLEEFVLPTNGPDKDTPERHYWFDFGSARIVSIDTNLNAQWLESVVAPWLNEVFASAGNRWKIVFFHHPVYTNGKYRSTRRLWNTIVPAMEKHNVNLVLSGHDHMYERSYPVFNRKMMKKGQGITYITTGGGGCELYCRNPEQIPQIARQYNEKHSFTIIDVHAEELLLRQIDIDKKTIDLFTVTRGKLADIRSGI